MGGSLGRFLTGKIEELVGGKIGGFEGIREVGEEVFAAKSVWSNRPQDFSVRSASPRLQLAVKSSAFGLVYFQRARFLRVLRNRPKTSRK